MFVPTAARFSIVSLLALGCMPKAGDVGALPGTESGMGSGTESGPDSDSESGMTEPSDASDSNSGSDTEDPPTLCEDIDGDFVPLSEDNAPYHFNPDQADLDSDGIGDVIDLCPTVADVQNAADSDDDGIGNACDRCARTTEFYNERLRDGNVIAEYRVRNIPTNSDFDGDGVGDACDNCVTVANCLDFDEDNRHEIGDELSYEHDLCQTDVDANGIGDACEGLVGPNAAGAVGFAADDDFDQDGLANAADACPRLPLSERIDCTVDACPNGAACTNGVCNHIDSDGDGLGNACDTCSFNANPDQAGEGGTQEDDPDTDFVGTACETAPSCSEQRDPRPHAFLRASAEGLCCVQLLLEDEATGNLHLAATCLTSDSDPTNCAPLLAPDRNAAGSFVPVRNNCSAAEEEAGDCWPLPARLAALPGILSVPPVCDAALAAEGITALENLREPITTGAVYDFMCLMPQFDQDFDAIGDDCDLCPLDFDPDNTQYIDANGRLWPQDGAYCNGEYLC